MSLANEIENASRLLSYAAENAKQVPLEVVLPIATAQAAEKSAQMTPKIETDFWNAFGRLSEAVKPVTVESLSAECAINVEAEKRSYWFWSNALLCIILPLSIASFLTSSIITDLDQKADAACKRETILKCATPALAGIPAAEPEDNELLNQGDLEATYQLMFFRLRWLNAALLFLPYKPGDFESIFSHELTKKSQRFNKAVWFARDLKERAQLIYGVISNYILPIFYAMLGAVAYGLRNLSDQVATRTVFASSLIRARVRFRLAILVGVVIGLFNDFTKGIALSPLAVAFLVGYAVEIFFSFLDAVVEASKRVKSAPIPERTGA
jgi:hypothetical protein